MKILLDTATILWMATEPSRLSPLVAASISDGFNDLFVSSVSIWEISTKCSIGKLKLAVDMAGFVTRLAADYPFEGIEFTFSDSLLEGSLPPIHRDPFDRMLICQALSRQLVIATPDRSIHQYDVPSIW